MLFCIGLCHTAIVATKKGSYGEFISESEDEFALLNAIKQFGFRFMKRDNTFIYLRVFNDEVRFELKGLLPFDPIRKIMSVVVKTLEGEHILFTKGADSHMVKRLSASD